MGSLRCWGIGLAALGLAGTAVAGPGEDVQIHGFVSQGFVLSEGNNVNGSSTDSSGSAKYQELGINGSWRPRGDLMLAAQFASVRAGEATDEYLTLEYGLLDYTPWQAENGRFGLRAGKVKLPFGFYNESRDAVFTRPGILMPQGIYLETSGAREFGYFSVYGGQFYADWYAGNHALYLEAGAYGDQSLGDSADIAILRADAKGTFRNDRGFLVRLLEDYDGGRFRAALSWATVDLSYTPSGEPFSGSNPFAMPGKLDFRQTILSFQYNWPRLSLTAEYTWRNFKLDDLIPGLSSSVADLEPSGAYLQATYRATPKWSGFLRYDEQIRDSSDRDGRKAEARFGLPRYYQFAHDWTVGTRYDLTSNLAAWAEFHYVDGVAWVNPLDNPDFNAGAAERYWNLATVMIGYRF